MIDAVMKVFTDLADFADARPALFWLAYLAAAALLIAVYAGRTPLVRQEFVKLWYVTRNSLTAEVGWRDVVHWLLIGALFAVPIAYRKGTGEEGDRHFHWMQFFKVLGIVGGANVIRVVLEGLSTSGTILRPLHGRRWRRDRKIKTAAILAKINLQTEQRAVPLPKEQLVAILTDLLDVIVSHVRDHRGNHKSIDVFANLLLVDGTDVVVVARDTTLHEQDYARLVPARYPMAAMAVGRAITSRKPVTVGDLRFDYPESPKNKPYRSILALSIASAKDPEKVLGALSIDSTTPYFFESFHQGVTSNAIENSLAPYLHTIALVLENLGPRDGNVVKVLC